MLTLGEELLLVALDDDRGGLRGPALMPGPSMRIGLNAAGMADLVAAGSLLLRKADGSPGITVTGGGDSRIAEQPLLTEVLQQARNVRESGRLPERCLKTWDSPSLYEYLCSLRERGVLTWDKPKGSVLYGRLVLIDADAAASARARVERVVTGAGPGERDMDLAGIVHGIRLDRTVYKGRRNRSKRKALATALAGQQFAELLAPVLTEVLDQKFTFDSSNDLKMATEMLIAWEHTP